MYLFILAVRMHIFTELDHDCDICQGQNIDTQATLMPAWFTNTENLNEDFQEMTRREQLKYVCHFEVLTLSILQFLIVNHRENGVTML